jgi:hypothetical protein
MYDPITAFTASSHSPTLSRYHSATDVLPSVVHIHGRIIVIVIVIVIVEGEPAEAEVEGGGAE